MGKGKLSKFEEMKTFPNVFQPPFKEVFGKDFTLKYKWSETHFRNKHPIVLELGCGKGEYTLGLAKLFPGKNFIGIDIKGARIWKGAKKAWQQKMSNVAFIRTRIEFINSFFGRGEVQEIWLTFPDPQLKIRHRKKRLTSARFLGSYQDFLQDRGIIHLKTDSEELYHYTLELTKLNGLHVVFSTEDLYGHQQMDKVYGIRTFYENRFIEQEKKICFLEFELPRDKILQEPGFPQEEHPKYLESESGT